MPYNRRRANDAHALESELLVCYSESVLPLVHIVRIELALENNLNHYQGRVKDRNSPRKAEVWSRRPNDMRTTLPFLVFKNSSGHFQIIDARYGIGLFIHLFFAKQDFSS